MKIRAAALIVAGLALTGCASSAQPAPTAPPTTDDTAVECLTVSDAQATAISEGVDDGITLTDWAALPAETGPDAWFVTATANGPGLDDEPFVFFTSVDPENPGAGIVKAADQVTASFVDWPMQEGATLDESFDTVQDCGA